jgi:hypothetical protein
MWHIETVTRAYSGKPQGIREGVRLLLTGEKYEVLNARLDEERPPAQVPVVMARRLRADV